MPSPTAFSPPIRRTVLPNGVRVLTEAIPSMRSVAVGAWVNAGSRDEAAAESGLTHFIEHMVFKGTARRRGYQINQRMEAVGGYLNAFTSKEHTCFYARGLDDHLERALDTVLDLVTRPTLPVREIEKEKEVVVEEIRMVEDTPEEAVFDHYDDLLYPEHPLGRPVLGTPESVRSFSQEVLKDYLARHYVPNRLVVTVAGRAVHDRVVRLVTKLLRDTDRAPAEALRRPPPAPRIEHRVMARPIQQAHLAMGVRTPGITDDRRPALSVLNTLLGGGMSSRLNQSIRERYGYCYAVYSFVNLHGDSGDLGVYMGTNPKRIDRARTLIQRELTKLAETPVSARMLKQAKQQLAGSAMLGLESLSNRMQHLGRNELAIGRIVTLDEALAEMEAVTAEQVRALAEDLFTDGRLASVALMPET